MSETEEEVVLEDGTGLKERIAGVVQKTIGGLEELGGILTGDPLTTAEGEFNVEVGKIREEVGEELDEKTKLDDE